MLCVPTASLLILAHQIYLSSKHDLSTWKGGGMGMFAAADSVQNRYAKIFIVEPDGSRNPLSQFSPEETNLLNSALEYPDRETFLRAVRKIAQENWTAMRQQNPVTIFNVQGEPVGTASESFHIMVPYGRRSGNESRQRNIEVQFWKIAYDPVTKRARSTLAQTFLFKPEELFRSAAD
jgi:hypothetical protein